MESEKQRRKRFYILIILLLIVAGILTYFNYNMTNIKVPNLENANYDNILKHINALKKVKKHT
jgi:hypothetical protein